MSDCLEEIKGRLRERRHRKWALKEARMMSRLAYTENESYQEQAREAIKLKAEVGRLKALLSYQGIPF